MQAKQGYIGGQEAKGSELPRNSLVDLWFGELGDGGFSIHLELIAIDTPDGSLRSIDDSEPVGGELP
jgi:hypothetical protein